MTGQNGADLCHRVYTESGQLAGTLLWEFKRTKTWSDGWVDKLKSEAREAGAEFAILATSAMPKDLAGFGVYDGVWVVTPSLAVSVAHLARVAVQELFRARTLQTRAPDTLARVYTYLAGRQFRNHLQTIFDAHTAMREELDRERRAATKLWAKREKQLEAAMLASMQLLGEVEGLAGIAHVIGGLATGDDVAAEASPSPRGSQPALPPPVSP